MKKISIKKGPILYKAAKKIIPGGTQLLSKRPELYLPDLWPSYYKEAKGCQIKDLDNNTFYDFATMGIGACSLGYANKYIDQKVLRAIQMGSMSTLNSHEEVEFAEQMLTYHNWAGGIRFAKTGGEACSIAARIARAYTSKEVILFCGYHGWHDWYLSANLKSSENLDQQLLKGLDTKGVPQSLKGTAEPFFFNDIPSLEKQIKRNKGKIAAIYMEPVRSIEPKVDFIEFIRKICEKENILLIIDEVTSGFRENLGGYHMTKNISPDIAVFGKALGNGYPISAILGKKEVMDVAEETFISSTFFTERIGFTAGIETLNQMEKINAQEKLKDFGKKIKEGWGEISEKYKVGIDVSGIDPLAHFDFKNDENKEKMTYFIYSMLYSGFLAGPSTYTTTAYSDKIISKYLEAVGNAFQEISKNKEGNLQKKYGFKIKHDGFRRLN